MKKTAIVLCLLLALTTLTSVAVSTHQIYIKKNPTNENGIEFGVDNASGFVRWRAYVKGLTNNSRGLNTSWTDSGNGWWYYDLSSIAQRVMWRLDGITNQKFRITYWAFKSDGTWEYGPQVEVVSDQILPTAFFKNISNGQTFTQNQFNISVSSNDNLSGVGAIRIYAVVPAGNSLSGWTPSGLANQFYKEFGPSSISHNFVAPVSGIYTFTLWVKDNAGNIAYEPGGPITITVTLSTPNPTPVPSPPTAPSNLKLTANAQTITITWQDNASNEDGYGLNKNGQFFKSLVANTTTYIDTGLQYGQNYCYNVYAIKSGLNSSGVESCLTLTAPNTTDYHYADSFTYPMVCEKIYRLEVDTQIPVGACFDYQPFGSLFAVPDKIHQGSDLNLKGVNDFGTPVYAIGNALIWDYSWTSGWGNYLILRISAQPGKVFNLTDGTTVTEIFVLYGHLNEIRIIKDTGQIIEKASIVKAGTYVAKGWQIGTVGDGNGNFSPHLHFEIRINGYSQLGYGYWPVSDPSYLQYFVDPIEFIENNWLPTNRVLKIIAHGYDRVSSRKVILEFNTNYWQRQGRVNDGLPLASVGWANHLWLTSSINDTMASWSFYVPQSGSYSLYLIIPRYYAQANNVFYKVWHSNTNIANPYEVRIDQANSDENKRIYFGTFYYNQNWRYSVDLYSQTTNNPVKNVAADAIMLVYEGDLGIGGGYVPPAAPVPSNQMATITSSGTITFKYSGTYNSPELYCSGGGLSWSVPVFSGGVKEKTVTVSQSAKVYCNTRFEDGQWMGGYNGIMANQHLFVDNQEIIYTEDNGQGGTNLVFNLVVENPNDPPDDPDIDDGPTTITADINISGSVDGLDGFGCSVSFVQAVFTWATFVNLLILFSPLILLLVRKVK